LEERTTPLGVYDLGAFILIEATVSYTEDPSKIPFSLLSIVKDFNHLLSASQNCGLVI
jgi:hypothetical protein